MEGTEYQLIISLICLAIILSVTALYYHVHTFEFVSFYDYTYVRDNPCIGEGITSGSIKWALTSYLVIAYKL